MFIKAKRLRHAASLVAIFLILSGVIIYDSSPLEAQTPKNIIPITSEPDHKIRFDNGKVRIYEVFLPKRKATLWHEHRADNFSVLLCDSEITIESKDRTSNTLTGKAGTVGFSSTALGPYSHRVIASGDRAFHVITMELISPKPSRSASANQRENTPFSIVEENSRGRVYHIILSPGQSTGLYTRQGSTALIAISTGRIVEEAEGKARRFWDFEVGDFKWTDFTENLSLKNEGSAPIEFVAIEVF
jgi:hypothetical protein